MNKEETLEKCIRNAYPVCREGRSFVDLWLLFDPSPAKIPIEAAMEEYAKEYKEIAGLISIIFHYGNFKPETENERRLEQKLIDVGLWPTSEEKILQGINI